MLLQLTKQRGRYRRRARAAADDRRRAWALAADQHSAWADPAVAVELRSAWAVMYYYC